MDNKMKQLINLVIKWTEENENLEIILIDRMIRTDSKFKFNLTKYSNKACREVLKAHVSVENIHCVDLKLEEQNEFDMFGKIGTKVKTHSGWKRRDGVHFRGQLGRKLFTQQFVLMMRRQRLERDKEEERSLNGWEDGRKRRRMEREEEEMEKEEREEGKREEEEREKEERQKGRLESEMKRRQWKVEKEEKKRGLMVRRGKKRKRRQVEGEEKRRQVEGEESKIGQLVREKEESRKRYCYRLMMQVNKMKNTLSEI